MKSKLIYVWIQLKKFNYLLVTHGCEDEYANMLAKMLPITKPEERKYWDKAAARASHREEKSTSDGRRPSETVIRKLLQYYNSYNDQNHIVPYT